MDKIETMLKILEEQIQKTKFIAEEILCETNSSVPDSAIDLQMQKFVDNLNNMIGTIKKEE